MRRFVIATFCLLGFQSVAQRFVGPVSNATEPSTAREWSDVPAYAFYHEGFDQVTAPDLPDGWATFSLSGSGFLVGTAGNSAGQANANGFWPVPLHGFFAMANDDACNCDRSNDLLISPTFNLAGRSYVRLGFSCYQNGSANQTAEVQMRTSLSGWQTVFAIPASVGWEEYEISVPALVLDEGFQFRFRYDDQNQYASGLAIDDVYLTETASDRFELSQFYAVYGRLPGSGVLYDQLPLTQAQRAHLRFGCDALNDGISAMDGRLAVEITGPLTHTDTSSHWRIDPGQSVNLRYPPRQTFTPYEAGTYVVSAELISDSVDSDPSDNLYEGSFSVHDSIYRRVNEESDGTGIVLSQVGDRLGTTYHLFADDTLVSVYVAIHPATQPGARFRVKVFDYDTLTSSIYSSSPVQVTTDDLGAAIRVPINHAFGTGRFLIVVEKEVGSSNLLVISSTARRKSPSGISLFQASGENWHHMAYYPFVHLVMPPVDSECPAHLQATIEDESCDGSGDGSISVEVFDANLSWTYTWSNGSGNVNQISNLTPGSYQVVVIDGNGCVHSRTFEVYTGSEIHATPDITPALCGNPSGSIEFHVAGGYPPYEVLFNGDPSGSMVNSLAAGSYPVTIVDDHGCTFDTSIAVSGTDVLSAVFTTSPSGCGAANGEIYTIPFGTGPFQFLWSTGSTGDTLTGLTSGVYSLTLSDSLGCTAVLLASLSDSNAPSVSATSIGNVLCRGASSGSIDIAIAGGTLPYDILWSNGSTSEDLSDVPAGSYVAQVTDALGCRAIRSAEITETGTELISTISAKGVYCSGDSSGNMLALASGGQPDYAYEWSTGSTLSALTSLAAGTYTVTITDAAGCTQTAAATIGSTASFFYTIDSIWYDTGASFLPEGAIFISTFGGTPPYTWSWSNGTFEEDLTEVDTGLFSVVIRDQLGCERALEKHLSNDPLQVPVQASATAPWRVFPNPVAAGSTLQVETLSGLQVGSAWQLWDVNGRLIGGGQLGEAGQVQVPTGASGIYVLVLTGPLQQSQRFSVVVLPR